MKQSNVQPKPLMPWLQPLKVPRIKLDPRLLGSAVLAAIGLAILQSEPAPPDRTLDPSQFCQEVVQPQATVTREELVQLLTVPERGERPAVENIVQEPYCRMSSLSIRAGATTERQAYPLASEPQTWLVILYEGDTYVGYGLKRS